MSAYDFTYRTRARDGADGSTYRAATDAAATALATADGYEVLDVLLSDTDDAHYLLVVTDADARHVIDVHYHHVLRYGAWHWTCTQHCAQTEHFDSHELALQDAERHARDVTLKGGEATVRRA